MRTFSREMPFEGGCDAHLCLNEGFTLWDFRWNSLSSWSEPLERDGLIVHSSATKSVRATKCDERCTHEHLPREQGLWNW